MVAVVFLIAIAIVALFAETLAPDPNRVDALAILERPSWDHPLGTDQLGRDLMARLMHGARVSLIVGVAAAMFATVGAVAVGAISAYWGGLVESAIQRLMDALMVFPTLVLAMAVLSVLGFSITKIIFVIGLAEVPRVQRVFRAQVHLLKEEPYVEAARAIGANGTRILVRHILPQLFGIFFVLFSIMLATAIIIEAALSFLGLGVQPPTASWGNLLTSDVIRRVEHHPHLVAFPATALASTIIAVNVMGEGLRDYFDPRFR